MAPLGPFAAGREVMVAVSGGADSTALALLLSRWGRVHGAIVDHGLRAESAAEAAVTATRLAGFGVPSTIARAGLSPGPAAAERARDARYRLLLQACREAGCPDLLLAHHAGDQAETVRMRQEAGSGPAGLAGMAAVSFRSEARLLRPLLSVPAARLRATLRAAGVGWVEDPSNRDPRSLRARLRAAMDPAAVADALAMQHHYGPQRARAERQLALELAAVQFHPAGFALVSDTISDAALAAVIWAISGRPYPPPPAGLSARSIHGVLLRSAGRLGPGMLIVREPRAVAPPAPALPDVIWDGRFRVGKAPLGATIEALGEEAAGIGRGRLPSIVRRTLPTFRRDGVIVAVPHLGFPNAETCRSVALCLCPRRPAAGAPFVNPCEDEGV